MKKILFLTTVVCAALFITKVQAQNFSVFHEGDSLYDGKVLTLSNYDANEEAIVCWFDVKNFTNDSLHMFAQAGNVSIINGAVHAFCWGVCPAGFPVIPYVIPANSEAAERPDGKYMPEGNLGTSQTFYKFFSDKGNDTVKIIVNYTYTATDVAKTPKAVENTLSAFPNPATNNVTINYSFNANGKHQRIFIKNILGVNVKEVVLSNNSGKISIPIDDLNAGIYFYSLQSDEEILATKKLVIKR